MMKILIEGENLLAKPPCEDKDDFKSTLVKYLPSDASGAFSVSTDGDVFRHVQKSDLWDYPITQINFHVAEDESCYGISETGISMLAFEKKIDDIDPYDIHLKYPPSFITTYEDRIQFVFVLYNFIPDTMSERSMNYLEAVIRKIENVLYAKYVNEILNPCSSKVNAWISTHSFKTRFTFGDLFQIEGAGSLRSIEELINRQNYIKGVRAKGGQTAAAVRKSKSVATIKKTIAEMLDKSDRITQGAVAICSGLSRKTVNKNWGECLA